MSEYYEEKENGRMLEECLDILLDTTKDSLRILPFLFVTYLIMEYIGHK